MAMLTCIGGLSSWAIAPGGVDVQCLKCHEETWKEGISYIYIHAPFMEEKCSICHAPGINTAVETGTVAEAPSSIRWFRQDRVPAESHWFLFPADTGSDVLWIETSAEDSQRKREPFTLPALESLPEWQNDQKDPQISDVEVRSVELGVFVSARVTWRTDKFSDSSLLFGTESLTSESRRDTYLRQKHEVILSGLEKDKEYRFSVVSEDVYGNRSVSAPRSFSTHAGFSAEDKSNLIPSVQGGGSDPNPELYRVGRFYLLQIRNMTPSVVFLGIDPARGAGRRQPVPIPSAQTAFVHPPLQGGDVINIQVCYQCHGNIKGAMSHPVNVLPPPGMIIPPEYPLLPDGKISCMSCHSRHGSNLPYRMIKPSRKELCVGCHVNY